ncbi:hypothetical protein V5799_005764 [Amblyomma americanum]|uniref:Uncharacterized protein n=1 Tax=Amblyomma americanum TaxID=6943 RepID=A0AAQ4DYB6_AMBAM
MSSQSDTGSNDEQHGSESERRQPSSPESPSSSGSPGYSSDDSSGSRSDDGQLPLFGNWLLTDGAIKNHHDHHHAGLALRSKLDPICSSPHICLPRIYSSPPPFPYDDDDDHPLLSPTSRRRNVQEVIAQARELLQRAVLETPRAVESTPVTTIFNSSYPDKKENSSPPPPPAPIRPRTTRPDSSTFHVRELHCPVVLLSRMHDGPEGFGTLVNPDLKLARALSIGSIRAAVDPILDSLEDETDFLRPRDFRPYYVSDELCLLYEHIEARWSNVCDEVKADMNARYDKFLSDCQRLLDAQPDDSAHDQLREGMKVGWRRLTAEMRRKFSQACQAFNDWRTRYVERELRAACSALRGGDRFQLLAATLRLELMDSLPTLEKRTQARAVSFWKELTEERAGDVDELFATDSE